MNKVTTKSRILFLMRYLFDHTDDEYSVTTAELKEELNKNGFAVTDTRTIRNDIEMIRNAGFDIIVTEKAGTSTRYNFGERGFEKAELRILLDAVESSFSLSPEKTEQLKAKLKDLAGQINVERLNIHDDASRKFKTRNNQVMYIVHRIMEAIQSDKRIRFKYGSVGSNDENGFFPESTTEVVSPCGTIWHHDRYYMVAFSEKRNKLEGYRIDWMGVPEVIDVHRSPIASVSSVRECFQRIDRVCDGAVWNVALRYKQEFAQTALEWFGERLVVKAAGEGYFDVVVPTVLSNPFFSWVFVNSRNIKITGPDHVLNLYRQLLTDALNQTNEPL